MSSPVILQAEAGTLPLPDESVDLVVTSPPYWLQREYTDGGKPLPGQIGQEPTWQEYIDALVDCTAEWVRVLKPTGSLFVNLGDKYGRGSRTTIHGTRSKTAYVEGAAGSKYLAGSCPPTGESKNLLGLPWRYAFAVERLGLIRRAEIIWHKQYAVPESVRDRVHRKHEHLFHFTRRETYYASLDEIRIPHSENTHTGRTRLVGSASGNGHRHRTYAGNTDLYDPRGKVPGSVWELPPERLETPPWWEEDAHYAAFPTALVRPLVLAWSPPEGVVLDPFGGTGTTALVAAAHGRIGISADLSGAYSRFASWRTRSQAERSLARGQGRPPSAKRVYEEFYGSLTDELDRLIDEAEHG